MDGISRMVKPELLQIIRGRYGESSKKDKDRVLNRFVTVMVHHR